MPEDQKVPGVCPGMKPVKAVPAAAASPASKKPSSSSSAASAGKAKPGTPGNPKTAGPALTAAPKDWSEGGDLVEPSEQDVEREIEELLAKGPQGAAEVDLNEVRA